MEPLEDRRVLAAVAWDGGGDGLDWHDALNWDSDSIPTIEDDVTIDLAGDRSVSILTASATAKSLVLNESLRISDRTLTVAEQFDVNVEGDYIAQFRSQTLVGADFNLRGNADFSGSSSSIVTPTRVIGDGIFTIHSGATAHLGDLELNIMLQNEGDINVDGFVLSHKKSLTNASTGTMRLLGVDIRSDLANKPTFLNQGELIKQGDLAVSIRGGAGTFINEGTIDVGVGLFKIAADATTTQSIEVSSGAELEFEGNFSAAAGVQLTGSGKYSFFAPNRTINLSQAEFLPTGTLATTSGNLIISNSLPANVHVEHLQGGVTFNADQAFQADRVTSATLRGTGNITLLGNTQIESSAFLGSGNLLFDAQSQITLASGNIRFSQPTRNEGNIIYSGTVITLANEFINAPDAVFHFTTGGSIAMDATASPFLQNLGSIIKSGTQESAIRFGGDFVNDGTLTIEDGTLDLSADTTTATSIDVPVGATLKIGGSFDPADGTTIGGAGDFSFRTGGRVDFRGANFLPTGNLDVSVNTDLILFDNTLPADVKITNLTGNIRFDADQTLADDDLGQPVLLGSGDITITGDTTIGFANFNSAGSVVFDQDATVIVSSSGFRVSRPVINHGIINWIQGSLRLGSTFTNAPDGTMVFTGGTSILADGNGETRLLRNEGLLRSSGSVQIGGTSINLDNSGVIQVDAGVLRVSAIFPEFNGRITLLNDAEWIQSNLAIAELGILTGQGKVSGNVTNRGRVQPGSGIGNLTVDGNYTQIASGGLEIEASGLNPTTQHDQLHVIGTATFAGDIYLRVQTGFVPNAGDEIVAVSYAAATGDFASVNVTGITNEVTAVIAATQATLLVGQPDSESLVPTFRGRAKPGTRVQLTSDIAGLLGVTTTDPQSGLWTLQSGQALIDIAHRIVATNLDDLDDKPRIDALAPLDIGDIEAEDLQGLQIADDSITFYPFGTDFDGQLEFDDIIVEFDDANLELLVTGNRVRSELPAGSRTFGGEVEFENGRYTLVGNGFASILNVLDVLPFNVVRVDVAVSDTEDGSKAIDYSVVGHFRKPDAEPNFESPQGIARKNIGDLLDAGTIDNLQFRQELLNWLNAVDGPGGAGLKLNLERAGTPEQFEDALREFIDWERSIQLLGLLDGGTVDFEQELRAAADATKTLIETSAASVVSEKIENINAANGFTEIKELIQIQTSFQLVDINVPVDLNLINDNVFTTSIDNAINNATLNRDLNLVTLATAEIPSLLQMFDREITGYRVDQVAQKMIDRLVSVANAKHDQNLNAEASQAALTAFFVAEATRLDLSLVQSQLSFTPDDTAGTYAPQNPKFSRFDTGNDFFFIVGNILEALPTSGGNIDPSGIATLLQDDQLPSGASLLTPIESEFEFKFRLEDQSIRLIETPQVGIGFLNRSFGTLAATGLLSFGLQEEENGIASVDFVGAFAMESDTQGLNATSVLVDGTGDDKGIIHDAFGTRIAAEATVGLSLESQQDSFYIQLDNAQASFDLDFEVNDASGFQVRELGLNNIVAEGFTAAFGGTRPAAGTPMKIPENALFVLVAEKTTSGQPAVEIDFDTNAEQLLTFGKLSASIPALPVAGNITTTVRNFGLEDVNGTLQFVTNRDFGIEIGGVSDALKELGIPEIVSIQQLVFEAGDEFDDGNLLDFSMIVSGGLDLNVLSEVIPVNAEFDNLRLDLAALTSGDVMGALDFGAPASAQPNTVDSFSGASFDIGPIDFGGVKLAGQFAIGKFNYTPNGSTQVRESLAVRVFGDLEFGAFPGLEADVFFTEFGPVAMSLSVDGLDIPIGSTGLAIKELGGKAILGAPDLPPVSELVDPLDLLTDQSGRFDFSDLAGTPDFEELISLGIGVAQVGLPTWEQDLIFALNTDIGIQGDPTSSLIIDVVIGARIEVLPPGPGESATGLQLFGLGGATIMAGTDQEINLGRAGLLLSFPESGPSGAFAFEMEPGSNNSDKVNIPATVRAGGTFVSQFDATGAFESLELKLVAEVKVESIAEPDKSAGAFGLEAAGVFVFQAAEPGQPVAFHGVIGANLTIDGGDVANIEGQLLVQLNTTGAVQQIDIDFAREKLPRLVIGSGDDARAEVAPGFGLFVAADVDLLGFIHMEGSLDLEIGPDGWAAGVELVGSLFGSDVTNGILRSALVGRIEVDTTNGFNLTLLQVEASADIELIEGFLDFHGEGDLLIEDDRFKNLSVFVNGTLFGFEFGQEADGKIGAEINEHGCLAIFLGDDPIRVSLLEDENGVGGCAITGEPTPTQMTVGNVAILERNQGSRTVDVPISFTGPRLVTLPLDAPLDPELTLDLEVWTMQRPDRDNASSTGVPADDFERLQRQRVSVPLTALGASVGGFRYEIPAEFSVPVSVLGDARVEADETFSVFVNILQIARANEIATRDDGFGTVTILNDDRVAEPPSDAVVFFDFEKTVPRPGTTFLDVLPENGPDVSRPQLTFDLNAVSPVLHSFDEVSLQGLEGLPFFLTEDTVTFGKSISAVTWTGTRVQEAVQEPVGPGNVNSQPTLGAENESEERQYYQFTISPTLSVGSDGITTGLKVVGIDFWNAVPIGTFAPGSWQVTYSLDDFEHILASGEIFTGDDNNFGNSRVEFSYPVGYSANMPQGDVTFRIYGPNTEQFNIGIFDALPWRIDNLALLGGSYQVLPPTVNIDNPIGDSVDLLIGKLPKDKAVPPQTPIVPIVIKPVLPSPSVKFPAIPRGFGFNGYASAATVYFDADGDGLSAGEPNFQADAIGRFELLVGNAFDTNNNHQIDLSEGVLTMEGGVDPTTGAAMPVRFRAPYGSPVISPLTTIVTRLGQAHADSIETAEILLKAKLKIAGEPLPASASVLTDHLIRRIENGELKAALTYVALLQVHHTVAALSTATSSDNSQRLEHSDWAFDAIADAMHELPQVDLTSPGDLDVILTTLENKLTQPLSTEMRNRLLLAIRNGNLAYSQIDAPLGSPFYSATKQLQRTLLTDTLPQIRQLQSGELAPADFAEFHALSAIQLRAESASLENVSPIAIRTESAFVQEPSAGATDLLFEVTLSEPSLLPVSLAYRTVDGSARAASDYEAASGTIVFAPGETAKEIRVVVFADEAIEFAESLAIQLDSPVHGLLFNSTATGHIAAAENTPLNTRTINIADPIAAAEGQEVNFEFLIPGIEYGTMEWGDGTETEVEVVATEQGLLARAAHAYDIAGTFSVRMALGNETSEKVIVTRDIIISSAIQLHDPSEPGKSILSLSGTRKRDHVLVTHNSVKNTFAAWVNNSYHGPYDAAAFSQIAINTGNGGDLIFASPHLPIRMVVYAGSGADVVFTGTGDDFVDLGSGNDQVFTHGGNDTVLGGRGNDRIFAGVGDDDVDAGVGHDRIDGGEGNDRLRGNSGRDLILGYHGNDYIDGGTGHDRIFAGPGDDVILAGAGNDEVLTGSGDDTVYGESGHDRVFGQSGDDRLFGGDGNDTLTGGSGDDTISGGNGRDTIFGGIGDDDLRGGSSADLLRGGIGDDKMFGDSGNDSLFGDAGDDLLVGGDGDDLLFGGSGNDTLIQGQDGGYSGEGEQIDSAATPSSTPELFAMDLNGDGYVSPVDVLLVVNRLNDGTTDVNNGEHLNHDVNGDDLISPIDVLLLINHLNHSTSEDQPTPITPEADLQDVALNAIAWDVSQFDEKLRRRSWLDAVKL